MNNPIRLRQLVFTVKDRCRVCYTCVRECPAKAIKIVHGQAEVLNDRCIGCGNCIRVCSQGAKIYLETIEPVEKILQSDDTTVACIAPSFPAEFSDINNYEQLVGMVRALGFNYVTEVAFGADIVSHEYKKILIENPRHALIAANCPTVVSFIERYHPELTHKIAPVASPMVAMARTVRKIYGEDIKIVFIGPCLSKKAESCEIDEVLTFRELRMMFKMKKTDTNTIVPTPFDPPIGRRGAIFPISRGMLRTINVTDIFDSDIIATEGSRNFQNAIEEFKAGAIATQHLELLACEGCIMGPGMSPGGKRFTRRTLVNNYARRKLEEIEEDAWKKYYDKFKNIDLSQNYIVHDQRLANPTKDEVSQILRKMGKYQPKDLLDCGACGYATCIEHAIAIKKGLAEGEMCLPYTIERLHKYNDQLVVSNAKLAKVRKVLQQKEKLAGMGQLSAGIAHELNNPLGIVIMYCNLLLEECPTDSQTRKDLELIVEQSNRCKKIVGGLLSFARKDQVNYTTSDAVDLMKQSIKSVLVPDNISININADLEDPVIMADQEQMIQVFSNLTKNAIEAMPDGGNINITIKEKPNELIFIVADSGSGIEQEYLDKIFEPFFTTKETGKGTGLGLPTIYGIVKMHKGEISVTSNTYPEKGQTGTTFKIKIPRIHV